MNVNVALLGTSVVGVALSVTNPQELIDVQPMACKLLILNISMTIPSVR
jgi:hypothetical protein